MTDLHVEDDSDAAPAIENALGAVAREQGGLRATVIFLPAEKV